MIQLLTYANRQSVQLFHSTSVEVWIPRIRNSTHSVVPLLKKTERINSMKTMTLHSEKRISALRLLQKS